MLGMVMGGAAPFSRFWLSFSPAYAVWLALVGEVAPRDHFWFSIVVAWAWSLLWIVTAACVLARTWRSAPAAQGGRWRKLREFLFYGSLRRKTALRQRILTPNAFQWLVERDRRSLVFAWSCALVICGLWFLGWWMWPRLWISPMNFFVTASLLIITLHTFVRQFAARRLGEDRRNDNLELLLTTSLSSEQIVSGQISAAQQQFRSLYFSILGLFVLMAMAGYLSRAWTLEALTSYTIIWIVLCFFLRPRFEACCVTSMWLAVNTGRASFAAFRSMAVNQWNWMWMVFNLRNIFKQFGRGSFQFPTGSSMELYIVVAFSSLFGIAALFGRSRIAPIRQALLKDLRLIAQFPLPDLADPQVKKWCAGGQVPKEPLLPKQPDLL
jgi:hypothetical protein